MGSLADDTQWLDATDQAALVRNGHATPLELLDASIERAERLNPPLNALTWTWFDQARQAAASLPHIDQPFRGVPFILKDLHAAMSGTRLSNGNKALKAAAYTCDHNTTLVQRYIDAGLLIYGRGNSPEFGATPTTEPEAWGPTRNPWDTSRSVGGSSGGSAALVAAGVVPIAHANDGGGSIRIPAGFNGLVGMKGTAGRIPRGPHTGIAPMTVVVGCLARSVRDTARWYDVCNGHDMRDPYSLPRVDGWESGLGTHLGDLRGKRVAIVPNHGSATIRPELDEMVRAAGAALAADAGLQVVDGVEVNVPGLGLEWAMANLGSLLAELGDRWPGCKDDLTNEISFGLQIATEHYNLQMAANVESQRTRANEAMAAIFDQVDFLICATNPDAAYPAEVTLNTKVGELTVGPENNGALTIPANIVGNPSCQVPIGFIDGLPVGMQIIAPHHHDKLVLDLAWLVERERPWPLVAPSAPV